MAAGNGSPCGACKFLRRKCAADCIFAPYFCSEQSQATFAAIHKVFGASNVSKLLQNLPVSDRFEAAVAIAYEAQARIRDPVYGCVAHIFALQHQVAYLQAQLMQLKAQLATNQLAAEIGSLSSSSSSPPFANLTNYVNRCISPQSWLDSVDAFSAMQLETESMDVEIVSFQSNSKKRPSQTGLSELQALALRMTKNEN